MLVGFGDVRWSSVSSTWACEGQRELQSLGKLMADDWKKRRLLRCLVLAMMVADNGDVGE